MKRNTAKVALDQHALIAINGSYVGYYFGKNKGAAWDVRGELIDRYRTCI